MGSQPDFGWKASDDAFIPESGLILGPQPDSLRILLLSHSFSNRGCRTFFLYFIPPISLLMYSLWDLNPFLERADGEDRGKVLCCLPYFITASYRLRARHLVSFIVKRFRIGIARGFSFSWCSHPLLCYKNKYVVPRCPKCGCTFPLSRLCTFCTLYSNYRLVVYKGVTYFMESDVIRWNIIPSRARIHRENILWFPACPWPSCQW